MKTPGSFQKISSFATRIAGFCRRIPERIFGNISWKPPGWVQSTADAWKRLTDSYPRLIAPAILGLFAVTGAAGWAWHWYSHLPQPRRVTARVEEIPVTKLKKTFIIPR